MSVEVPKYYEYMNPILTALRELGGSASNDEMYERVVTRMKLSNKQLALMRQGANSNMTQVAYNMTWARTYLKNAGYLENSGRGVWALTAEGKRVTDVNEQDVIHTVRELSQAKRRAREVDDSTAEITADVEETDAELEQEQGWRATLMQALLAMPADAFERLCQRLLRESGFVEVTVMGRSGDGGIDGTGVLRIQGIVSFHVLFQSKRWQGSVGSREIRDFRGAMVGRTDKGLFITTGTFTRDAQKEALRDGAPPIDLIDGEQLLDLLKSLKLGVETVLVEEVRVKTNWFENL